MIATDSLDALCLKSVDDCQILYEKMTKIFNNSADDIQDSGDVKIHMQKLEVLLIQEIYSGTYPC